MAQKVKNLPAMQETQVQSLGQADPLEKGMATHSSIFAWRIPSTERPGGLQSMGSQRVGHDYSDSTRTCKSGSFQYLQFITPEFHLDLKINIFLYFRPLKKLTEHSVLD